MFLKKKLEKELGFKYIFLKIKFEKMIICVKPYLFIAINKSFIKINVDIPI
jgi:hypothetical protein